MQILDSGVNNLLVRISNISFLVNSSGLNWHDVLMLLGFCYVEVNKFQKRNPERGLCNVNVNLVSSPASPELIIEFHGEFFVYVSGITDLYFACPLKPTLTSLSTSLS